MSRRILSVLPTWCPCQKFLCPHSSHDRINCETPYACGGSSSYNRPSVEGRELDEIRGDGSDRVLPGTCQVLLGLYRYFACVSVLPCLLLAHLRICSPGGDGTRRTSLPRWKDDISCLARRVVLTLDPPQIAFPCLTMKPSSRSRRMYLSLAFILETVVLVCGQVSVVGVVFSAPPQLPPLFNC